MITSIFTHFNSILKYVFFYYLIVNMKTIENRQVQLRRHTFRFVCKISNWLRFHTTALHLWQNEFDVVACKLAVRNIYTYNIQQQTYRYTVCMLLFAVIWKRRNAMTLRSVEFNFVSWFWKARRNDFKLWMNFD